MKVIFVIMLAVVTLDALVYAAFFRSVVSGALAAVGIVLVVVLVQRWRRTSLVSTQHGWALGKAAELSDPDRPAINNNAVIEPSILNLGMLVIGAPGAGKSESVELGYINSLRAHSPGSGWAFFEGKGDIDIYKKCVAMGARPDHFFSSELPGSESINLMAGEAHDVIDRLGKVLIGTTASTSFYMDEQRAVLARVIPLLLALKTPVNLRDLYVSLCVEDAAAALMRRARDAGVDAVALSLATQWLELPFNQRVKNIAGLLNRLFVFVSGPYADRLNAYRPDIDIREIVPNGKSIYLHLPLTEFSRAVAVAIVEAFAVEARKRQLGGTDGLQTYPLVLDDWGEFFHDGFRPFSARCRSAAMPLSFGFQSRAQLDSVSRTYADELDDTIATKIIMRVQGEATADYAVRLLGEYDARDVSTSQYGARDGSSLSYGRRFRIEPRQLRELQPGEAFVSTLIKTANRTINPLWRLRFPLPDFTGWKSVPMPATQTPTKAGEGLGFWELYMNPNRLAEIHSATLEAEQLAEVAAVQRRATTRDVARVQAAANPGLDMPEVLE